MNNPSVHQQLVERNLPRIALSNRVGRNESESSRDLARGSSAVRMLEIQIDPQDAPQVLRSVVLEAAFDG